MYFVMSYYYCILCINPAYSCHTSINRLITFSDLVAFYDIQPGNVVGLFLQPRSLHRANIHSNTI